MSGLIVYINPKAGKGLAAGIFTDLCRREPRLSSLHVALDERWRVHEHEA